MTTSTSEFDREVTLAPTAEGRWTGRLSGGFTIGAGVGGGLLLAAVGTGGAAALADAGHTRPLTLAATFLTAATPGPYTVGVTPVRRGRTSSVLRAGLSQPDGDAHGDGHGDLPVPAAGSPPSTCSTGSTCGSTRSAPGSPPAGPRAGGCSRGGCASATAGSRTRSWSCSPSTPCHP